MSDARMLEGTGAYLPESGVGYRALEGTGVPPSGPAAVQVKHLTGTAVPHPQTLTFTSSTTAGNRIIAIATGYNGGSMSSITATAVTDSKGNTYSYDFGQISGAMFFAVYSAPITTGGSSHQVIYNEPQNLDVVNFDIIEVSGLASTPLDKTSANSGTSVPYTTGSTGTLSQAAEIVIIGIGFVSFGGLGSITPESPYLDIGEEADGSNYTSGSYYKIVSATTAINATITAVMDVINNFQAFAVTYKGA